MVDLWGIFLYVGNFSILYIFVCVVFNRSRKSDNLSEHANGDLANDRFTVVVDRDLFGNRSTVSLEASTADLARPLTGWSSYFFLFPPFETRPCRCQVRA